MATSVIEKSLAAEVNAAFVMPYGGDIGSETDVNNLQQPGYYRTMGSANQPQNLPVTISYGALYVVKVGNVIHQYLIRPESPAFYIRARGGNPATWSNWRQITVS